MNWNEIFGYEEKTGTLYNLKTKHVYRNLDRDGYIRVRVLGREYRAHRIIWEMVNNATIPDGLVIDHIDRDASNNKIGNLRLATIRQNLGNTTDRVPGRVLPKGVTLNPGGKFRARISHNGKVYSLGTYNTVEEAFNVVKAKDLELRGEFSVYYTK